MAAISSRRPLISLVKITSKKNKPEMISFKYGNVLNKNETKSSVAMKKNDDLSTGQNEVKITTVDQFLIPEAGEASKAVKMQVIKILELI
jgi:hypothetical protein